MEKTLVLLKIVEGARVALIKYSTSDPEILPTRYDLFQYRGGIGWGYKGSGVRNLAFAIAARLQEDLFDHEFDVNNAAEVLIQDVLSQLEQDAEHQLDMSELKLKVTG